MARDLGRDEELREVFAGWLNRSFAEMHTALPGRVKSYDATKQLATVQVQLKREFDHVDGTMEEILVSPCVNVPVLFPRAGGYAITFPVQVGDPCLVVFLERDADGWLGNGQPAVPPTGRRHHFSDAVAILGLFPGTQPLSPAASAVALQLRNEAGTKTISILSTGILIDSNGLLALESAQAATINGDTSVAVSGGTTVTITAQTVASLIGIVQAVVQAPLVNITSTGALTLSALGPIAITDGTNELLTLISEALDEIATSTVSGSPLSNASNIAAIKTLVDAMRT